MKNFTSHIDLKGTDVPCRLRVLREQHHLTQSNLAEKAGLSYRTVHDLEAGRRERILEKTLMLLATALEVELGDLLGVEDAQEDAAKAPRPLHGWRPVALIVGAVLVVLLVGGALVWRSAVGKAVWERDGATLTVRDGYFGIEIWKLEAPDQIRLVEEAPWDPAELLVGLGARSPEGGRLLCLDRTSGRQFWEMRPDLQAVMAAFGEEIVLAGNLGCKRLTPVDLDGDGALEVVAEFVHRPYYPTVLCLVDRGGRRLKQYAVKGHTWNIAVTDLDADGQSEILVTGVNNAPAYQGAMLTLLDAGHFGGATVDSLANPESSVRDSSRIRVILPRFPAPYQAMMADVRHCASMLAILQGPDGKPRLSVEVGSSADFDNRLIVTLDHELRPVRAAIKDKFLENIAAGWPDSLKDGTGPGDAGWRAEWLASAVRFEKGERIWPAPAP